MKVKLITVLMMMSSVLGFSQFNSSIDFIGGIEYSYRNLTTSSEDGIVAWGMENRDNKESGKFNWRTGFNYNKRLTGKIFLKTGLRLASVGYKGEKMTGLRWGSEIDGVNGWTPDPSLPHEIQFISDYWFAEIPIAGRYEFNEKKFVPFFELGISPSIFLVTRKKTITDLTTDIDFQNEDASSFNKVHIVGFISFGMNYSINDKIQLFGQPTFRYHLTKLVDAPVREHLYNSGIEIGIRRKIK